MSARPQGPAVADAMRRAAEHFGAGQLGEARALCDAILRADPRHFYALHLAATIAAHRGDAEECVAFATRALAQEPNHVEVLCNRGAALRMLNRHDEAIADYDRALAVRPGAADALNNRGVALCGLNRHAEAIESYSRALDANPAFHRARFNRALSRLVSGDLERGWVDHEARWLGSDTQSGKRPFAGPEWTGGEDVRGKTVLLTAEQGLGDMIMFARYARFVKERGARVALEVQPPLKALFAGLDGVDEVVAIGEPLPAFDFHIPLMSLARVFATRLDSIPARVPYLAAPAEHVERWRARLGALAGPRVGLVWSGSTTLRNDRNRSISLADLAPIRAVAGSLVCLQKEVRESDRAALADAPRILHFENEIADFRDTAALVSLMDVVISVDTSTAHLAGAMARPVWLMLPFSPDWRWLLRFDDSPWYPSARLFRQPRVGDWSSVIARLAEAVGRLPVAVR